MAMPISTINDTTWADASSSLPQEASYVIRRHHPGRRGSAFISAELILLSIAVLLGVWNRGSIEALILGVAGGFVLHVAIRMSSHAFAAGSAAQKVPHKGILIVGAGALAHKLYSALESDPVSRRSEISEGFLTPPTRPADPGIVVDLAGLDLIVKRERISHVVVAEEDAQHRAGLAVALVDLRLRGGLRIVDAFDYYEERFGKIWIEALSSEWFVYTNGFEHSRASAFLKRCVDVIGSLILLLVTSPVLAIVAVAIKLDSPGPLLFRQFRVGLFGSPFVIYKFRSMRQDAESQAGPLWAAENDSRTTRIGRFLRKLRIDEIPQVINVLRGEMSLVGPRPERPCFFDRLSREVPFFELRHCVKPGITGLAQVKYRYGASVEDTCRKLQYDIYYAKHRSFACDVKILFLTVGIVLFGKGR